MSKDDVAVINGITVLDAILTPFQDKAYQKDLGRYTKDTEETYSRDGDDGFYDLSKVKQLKTQMDEAKFWYMMGKLKALMRCAQRSKLLPTKRMVAEV